MKDETKDKIIGLFKDTLKEKTEAKEKRKKKTKLVCLPCANDPMSPREDGTIPRGENIVKFGKTSPYCYDCGEDHSVEKMPIDWKPEKKENGRA